MVRGSGCDRGHKLEVLPYRVCLRTGTGPRIVALSRRCGDPIGISTMKRCEIASVRGQDEVTTLKRCMIYQVSTVNRCVFASFRGHAIGVTTLKRCPTASWGRPIDPWSPTGASPSGHRPKIASVWGSYRYLNRELLQNRVCPGDRMGSGPRIVAKSRPSGVKMRSRP